eukprot:TRINITY_DN114446_c0_g1_i1.p1 TRINITY_DN114446_c0_g1~~TRINITY_DN114446_c0_g1_i1.p1  ORF type:complete len:467 (-),score=76.20 TRINITY_DN114446_c0_g1_i1:268-1620(-)
MAPPVRRPALTLAEGSERLELDGADREGVHTHEVTDVQIFQVFLDVTMPALDKIALALSNTNEDAWADSLESSLAALRASLTALSVQLPVTANQCEEVASSWEQMRLAQDPDAGSPITPHELANLALGAKILLEDACNALADISRDEVEELAEVGLAVARLSVSAAQAGAEKLQDAVEALTSGAPRNPMHDGPIIEDLSDPSAEASRAQPSRANGRGNVNIRMPRPKRRRRILWTPLWPRLKSLASLTKSEVSGSLYNSLPERSNVLPQSKAAGLAYAALLLGLTVTSPVWVPTCVVFLTCLLCALPFLLLLDMVLQYLYEPRAERLEALAEGVEQILRLWYITARLAFRRAKRFCRSMVHRLLAGRTPLEALSDGFREVRRDPKRFLQAGAASASSSLQQAFRAARAAWAKIPPSETLRQSAQALWSPSATDSSTVTSSSDDRRSRRTR